MMKDEIFQQYLEQNGWIIECESPLEIRHNEGSFATMYAAKVLLAELQSQYKDENGIMIDKNTSRNNSKDTFIELKNLFNTMDEYIQSAYSQENSDRGTNVFTEDGLSSKAYALWETTYSLVFNKNMSHKIKDCLNELNVALEYYDPDTSYKEDVLTYYNAVKIKVDTLTKLLQPSSVKNRMSDE